MSEAEVVEETVCNPGRLNFVCEGGKAMVTNCINATLVDTEILAIPISKKEPWTFLIAGMRARASANLALSSRNGLPTDMMEISLRENKGSSFILSQRDAAERFPARSGTRWLGTISIIETPEFWNDSTKIGSEKSRQREVRQMDLAVDGRAGGTKYVAKVLAE